MGKYYSRCMRSNDLTTIVLKKIIIEHIDDGDLIQSALTVYAYAYAYSTFGLRDERSC